MIKKTIALTSVAFMLVACGKSDSEKEKDALLKMIEEDVLSYSVIHACGQNGHNATVTSSERTGKSRIYLDTGSEQIIYNDEGPTGAKKQKFIDQADDYCLRGIIPN
ncbi:MAG: hypothetical protein ACXW30_05460 [Micavibrio sp.]